jgi:hypothetical protein
MKSFYQFLEGLKNLQQLGDAEYAIYKLERLGYKPKEMDVSEITSALNNHKMWIPGSTAVGRFAAQIKRVVRGLVSRDDFDYK